MKYLVKKDFLACDYMLVEAKTGDEAVSKAEKHYKEGKCTCDEIEFIQFSEHNPVAYRVVKEIGKDKMNEVDSFIDEDFKKYEDNFMDMFLDIIMAIKNNFLLTIQDTRKTKLHLTHL